MPSLLGEATCADIAAVHWFNRLPVIYSHDMIVSADRQLTGRSRLSWAIHTECIHDLTVKITSSATSGLGQHVLHSGQPML